MFYHPLGCKHKKNPTRYKKIPIPSCTQTHTADHVSLLSSTLSHSKSFRVIHSQWNKNAHQRGKNKKKFIPLKVLVRSTIKSKYLVMLSIILSS